VAKPSYGAADQAVTITLALLASASARESTAIVNADYLDALVTVKVKTGSGSAGGQRVFWVYAYGTTGGTTYPDTVTGTDANVTLNDPTQLRRIGTVFAPTNDTTYIAGPFSVASGFFGILPQRWGVVVFNNTGLTVATDAALSAVTYQGVTIR